MRRSGGHFDSTDLYGQVRRKSLEMQTYKSKPTSLIGAPHPGLHTQPHTQAKSAHKAANSRCGGAVGV